MLRNRFVQILLSPEPAPGGGGDPAPPFTAEQTAALGTIINQAITSHAKREKPLAEQLKAIDWKSLLTPVVTELVPQPPESGTPPAPSNQPTKPDPKVAALEAKVTELTTALTRQQEEAKAQADKARNVKAFADLKSALTNLVRPEALDIAASHLFHAQQRVTFDDQGNPLLTVKRAPYAGAAEEEVAMPLADGVQHWAKSTEAKFFAPAPGNNVSTNPARPGQAPQQRGAAKFDGNGLPTYDQPAGSDAERQRRAAERAEFLSQKYPHLANT